MARGNNNKRNGCKGTPTNQKGSRNRNNGYRKNMATDSSKVDQNKSGALSPLNDFAWYNNNPELTVAAANIPFPYRPGMSLPHYTSVTPTDDVLGEEIPGVMRINWIPSIGQAGMPTDPINIVGKEIFNKVRSVYSGSLDAEAPDFVIYMVALDSIFSYISTLKRLYRAISTFSPNNYVVPNTLLAALGMENVQGIEDLRRNKMILFQSINELIKMTGKFNCPAIFDYFTRHYWMSENVYTDAESANSQFYVFNQSHYYKFALKKTPDNVDAGGLEAVPLDLVGKTTGVATYLYTFGKDLIDALASNDSSYVISGYLQRAYEGTPNFNVAPLDYGELIVPAYVPEVLAQIENIEGVEYTLEHVENMDISQNPKTNCVIYNPTVGGKPTHLTYGRFKPTLSIRSDNPSIVDIVEATRLTNHLNSDGTIIAGTEIVTYIQLYHGNVAADAQWILPDIVRQITVVDTDNQLNVSNMRALAAISNFDWHPKFIVLWPTQDNDSVCTFMDLHNTTVIDPVDLQNLHRICVYSEFNCFSK